MSSPPTPSIDYCSDMLRRQDQDRWLAARYAPKPLRHQLSALGALRIELKRIPSSVSEPALGEIRLQWWREALDEIRAGKPPRAHPVVEAVAATGIHSEIYAPYCETMIDAGARPLYGEPFTSFAELSGWFKAADGAADAIAVLLAGGGEAMAEQTAQAGAAFAMAREGCALAPNLAADVSWEASKNYQAAAPFLAKAPPSVAPAILHLALTPLYVRGGGKPFPLRKRLQLFSAMAFAQF